MLLTQVRGIGSDAEVTAEYDELKETLNNLLNQTTLLIEDDVGRVPPGALGGTGDHPSAEDEYWRNRKGQGVVPKGAMGTNDELPPLDDRDGGPGKVDVGGANIESVMNSLDTVTSQMAGAKRAMGILNKMGDSGFRTKHKSRVMGLMNKIRANLARVSKNIQRLLDDA